MTPNNEKIEKVEVLPDPRRMVEGLRDTGYEFNTALADLIDNSIAADATAIDIRLDMDLRGQLRLSIADNGIGMDRAELINAMRYGSKERPHPSSLGKFGLGLKTASTAFCRRLLVTSRRSSMPLRAFWDLDHIADHGWELQIDSTDEETLDHLKSVAGEGSGTVVVWEKIDRLLRNYANPTGAAAKKAVKRIVNDLREHVAMVFQRFLDPDDKRAPTIVIQIDGEKILPWDPFCLSESELVGQKEVEVEDVETKFKVRAYVLPRREEFSSPEAAAIAKLGNNMQGFYVYRENRLIHYADWMGMFSKEPHGSLLRVEFSFDHSLDDAFHIDIKKSQIVLDDSLYAWLKDEFLPAPRRAADDRYRQGQRKAAKAKADSAHSESNTSIASKQTQIQGVEVTPVPGRNDEAMVRNAKGEFKFKLRVTDSRKSGELFVQPVDSVDDGVLFEPALIDGQKAVRINTSHQYYHKVYVPNLKSGVTIQGMDSLLWALCVAELSTIDSSTVTHFEELRYELSRILRRLVADLPEPDLNSDEAD